jgi:hypothetical protein
MLPDLHLAREAAERLLTDLIWRSATVGSCQCPGGDKHSGNDKTCAVFIDRGWPIITCFHDNCEEDVRALNGEILAEAPDGVIQKREWTEAEKREWRWNRDIENTARIDYLPKLTALAPMTADDWRTLSPVPIPEKPVEQWRLLLRSLFTPADVIWCGELWQSGKPEYKNNFRTVDAWLKTEYGPLGEQMSLIAFNRTGYDTEKGTLYFEGHERTPKRRSYRSGWYTLVESDTVDKGKFSNVQRWLAKQKGFVLRAVIDTGGKSMHAWYDSLRYHADARQLSALLRGLSADRQALTHITARAPGITRTDTDGAPVGQQRLLYLNPPKL